MHMKIPAKPTVIHRYIAHFLPWLVRAASTAITAVKLDTSNTTVFVAPAQRFNSSWAATNSCGYLFCIKPKPANKPPKVRTSVARNSHIPILLVSNCCSMVVK